MGELQRSAQSLATGLIDGGVHCIHVETLYEPQETKLLLSTIIDLASVPVFASVACRVGTEPETVLGQPLSEFLQILPKGLAAIGVNCGLTPVDAAKILPTLSSLGLPTIAQPTPAPDGTRQQSSLAFAQDLVDLLNQGVIMVGGCCGTNFEDIQAVAKAV